MGDYRYFRYLKDVKIEDIEHIKLISKDSSECDVKKFRIIEKKEISRHFSFLLDHSGSMGGKRANVLQASLFNAVLNDVSKKSEKNTIYTIYKFDHKNRRIVSSRDINEIKNIDEKIIGLYPNVGENLDYLNTNNLNLNFLYRKLDQHSWQYCNKGFFNFKSYIPKIISTLN